MIVTRPRSGRLLGMIMRDRRQVISSHETKLDDPRNENKSVVCTSAPRFTISNQKPRKPQPSVMPRLGMLISMEDSHLARIAALDYLLMHLLLVGARVPFDRRSLHESYFVFRAISSSHGFHVFSFLLFFLGTLVVVAFHSYKNIFHQSVTNLGINKVNLTKLCLQVVIFNRFLLQSKEPLLFSANQVKFVRLSRLLATSRKI